MHPFTILTALISLFVSTAHAGVFIAQGAMAGEPTSTSVLLQTRLTSVPGPALDSDGDIPGAAGEACFEYGVKSGFSYAQRTPWQAARAENDFIVRASLTGLRPGQVYHYRPIFGASRTDTQRGRAGQFATLPGGDSDRAVTFIVGSCMNYMKFMFGPKGKAGPI